MHSSVNVLPASGCSELALLRQSQSRTSFHLMICILLTPTFFSIISIIRLMTDITMRSS